MDQGINDGGLQRVADLLDQTRPRLQHVEELRAIASKEQTPPTKEQQPITADQLHRLDELFETSRQAIKWVVWGEKSL
jgi:hypothetical protein